MTGVLVAMGCRTLPALTQSLNSGGDSFVGTDTSHTFGGITCTGGGGSGSYSYAWTVTDNFSDSFSFANNATGSVTGIVVISPGDDILTIASVYCTVADNVTGHTATTSTIQFSNQNTTPIGP